jgi:hypothetical protein
LRSEGAGPFDLVFIDADKPNNPNYLEWALTLSRPGSIIIADNVVRDGAVVDPRAPTPTSAAFAAFSRPWVAIRRLTATAIQTVGVKGYDGFALMLPNELAELQAEFQKWRAGEELSGHEHLRCHPCREQRDAAIEAGVSEVCGTAKGDLR